MNHVGISTYIPGGKKVSFIELDTHDLQHSRTDLLLILCQIDFDFMFWVRLTFGKHCHKHFMSIVFPYKVAVLKLPAFVYFLQTIR